MTTRPFELRPKEFFGFFCETEPRTGDTGIIAGKLAHAFSSSVGANRYGGGVKSVTVGLVLTDPDGLGKRHAPRKPKFTAGTRAITGHGVTVVAEDTLEFSLRPRFLDVCNATTEAEVAGAILSALKQSGQIVEALEVPNFDLGLFLSDLETFLERASTRGAYVH